MTTPGELAAEWRAQSGAAGGRPTESFPVLRVRDGAVAQGSDVVAAEEPLEIRLEGDQVAVTMRTPVPGQDAELALGFLLGEAIVRPDDVAGVGECRAEGGDGGVATVRLRPGSRRAAGWQRRFYTTSSCGICGKQSIAAVRQAAEPVTGGPSISPEALFRMPAELLAAQRVFERTGGLHAAAIFDPDGRLLVLREDVGRHNAVDKVIGRAAMDGTYPLSDHVLMVSGRASFEIAQKALLARVAVVAAVSAPSSLAVRLARESGMTLIGFLREGGFNVYSGRERVVPLF